MNKEQNQSSLPPMVYLRTFEALSRHLNFTSAAGELGVTQASVSQQTKALEQWIGALLVVRSKRGCRLTQAGSDLSESLQRAFGDIRNVFREIRGHEESVLRIGVLPSFASSWLGPRMTGFRSANPDLSVRMALGASVDSIRFECDVAIVVGDGQWADTEVVELFRMTFTPMCSPTLLRDASNMLPIEELLSLPLIARRDAWWRLWLDAAGRDDLSVPLGRDIAFGAQHLEAEAAVNGEGVALLTPALFTKEIESGALVRMNGMTAADGRSYWLVYPRETRNLKKIRRFRDWVVKEAEQSLRLVSLEVA